MNAKHLLLLTTFLACGFLLTGCFEENEEIFDESLVEFASTFQGTYSAAVPDGAGLVELPPVQLIGEQRPEGLEVNFSTDTDSIVVDEDPPGVDGDGITRRAEVGTHYALPQDGTLTIEADSSSAVLLIDVLDTDIPAGVRRGFTVALNGNEAEGVEPAVNVSRFTIYIEGEQ